MSARSFFLYLDGRRMITFKQPRALDNYLTDNREFTQRSGKQRWLWKGWPGEHWGGDKEYQMPTWVFLHRASLRILKGRPGYLHFIDCSKDYQRKKMTFFFLLTSGRVEIYTSQSNPFLCAPLPWAGPERCMQLIYRVRKLGKSFGPGVGVGSTEKRGRWLNTIPPHAPRPAVMSVRRGSV